MTPAGGVSIATPDLPHRNQPARNAALPRREDRPRGGDGFAFRDDDIVISTPPKSGTLGCR
jgi:hypothetical protein